MSSDRIFLLGMICYGFKNVGVLAEVDRDGAGGEVSCYQPRRSNSFRPGDPFLSLRAGEYRHSCRTCIIKTRSLHDGKLVALPAADALPQVEDALEAVVDQDLRGDGAAVAAGAVDQGGGGGGGGG